MARMPPARGRKARHITPKMIQQTSEIRLTVMTVPRLWARWPEWPGNADHHLFRPEHMACLTRHPDDPIPAAAGARHRASISGQRRAGIVVPAGDGEGGG